MFNKSLIRLIPLLLIASMLLAGCTTNTAVAPTETGKKIVFTVGYPSGDPAARAAMEEVITSFMTAHPSIEIKNLSENSGSSYMDWLKTKDAVGEFPDLIELQETQMFSEAGKIAELPVDLVQLFEAPPEIDGKVWNAPIAIEVPRGIIYSKKAYADAGITELPRTYDEFLAIQEQLKASGISPIVVGAKDNWHMSFWLNKFLIDQVYSEDPDWNSKKTAKEVSFTDDNVVQAMTDYKELFTKYVDKGWLSTPDNQTASFLLSGKAAQLFSGTWMFAQLEEGDPNFEYGFYPVPDREGKLHVTGLASPKGWSLSAEVMKDPEKVEAIKTFIHYFFAPEQYAKYLASMNAIPSTKEKVTYESGEAMQAVLRLMSDPEVTKSLAIDGWWGDNQIPPQFRTWFYKKMQEMVLNDGDVSDYMQQVDSEYDQQVIANSM